MQVSVTQNSLPTATIQAAPMTHTSQSGTSHTGHPDQKKDKHKAENKEETNKRSARTCVGFSSDYLHSQGPIFLEGGFGFFRLPGPGLAAFWL